MSLFQSTFLPNLKDPGDETEVRKMGLDLIKKINAVNDVLESDVATLEQEIAVWVDDSRITTGTVNRTETALPLEIGQTAIINWACGVAGGVARAITLALPDVAGVSDTYQVVLSHSEDVTASLQSSAVASVVSSGAVAGGSTIIVNSLVNSGSSETIWGYVKRLT